MKIGFIIVVGAFLVSWGLKSKMGSASEKRLPITGTWKLISGTLATILIKEKIHLLCTVPEVAVIR
jgi:hypothetical protein